jgi:hypothetical protein
MAHATCLRRRPARTSPINSQTEHDESLACTSTSKNGGWKDKMHKLDDKWRKVRPYVERLNGTIVPLRSVEEQERESAVSAGSAFHAEEKHASRDETLCTNRNE